jgi:hypothetical protein
MGVPQSAQKAWARFLPDAAVLMYILGCPRRRWKSSACAGTLARKGDPDNV